MLAPLGVDHQRDHAQLLGQAHPVDQDRNRINRRQVRGEQLGQRGLGAATNRRLTADHEVAWALAVTAA